MRAEADTVFGVDAAAKSLLTFVKLLKLLFIKYFVSFFSQKIREYINKDYIFKERFL